MCPKWKGQQKILWVEVRKETGRGKIRDLFADGRCGQAVLDFLSSTDVGRLVPTEDDTGSDVSEWERSEREAARRAEAEAVPRRSLVLGRNHRCSYPLPSFMASAREE